MTPQELRAKQTELFNRARAHLDTITDDTPRDQAASIEAEFDGMMEEHDALGRRAERLERVEAAERKAEELQEREQRGRDGEAPGVDLSDDLPSYRDAFAALVRARGRAYEMAPEMRAALEREARAQTTTNAAGGYTIPEEMLAEVQRTLLAFGPMYDPGVTRELMTTGGNDMPIPTIDDTGVTAGAHTEGATLTDDGGKDATFGEIRLGAFGFDTEWVKVSLELMQDSAIAMEAFISSLLGERLGRIANAQLTTGTGSGAPNGIVTASALGVTAASATAITFDEIIDLEHSVDPAYRAGPNVRYMLHDGTVKYVRKLKDGDGNYLWQQGDVKNGIPSSLNGRPVTINQDMAQIATGNKTILFGDFSRYVVRKVGNPMVASMNDKDFWPGVGVAGYIRFDGDLLHANAVKHLIQA